MLDHAQHVATVVGAACLQGKPFVQHQRVVLEQLVKARQGRFCQGMATAHQGRQGVEALGHVARVFDLLVGLAGPNAVARAARCQAQHGQGQPSQRAAPAAGGVWAVGALGMVVLPRPDPIGLQCQRQFHAQGFAHAVDALRIDHGQLLGNVVFRGQGQHQLFEGGVQLRVVQHGAQRFDDFAGQIFLVFLAFRAYWVSASSF